MIGSLRTGRMLAASWLPALFLPLLWLAALVLGLATGCGEGKRRYFAACGSNEECESDNCYTGHCTTSCTTSAESPSCPGASKIK